jgi:hypothetical protein
MPGPLIGLPGRALAPASLPTGQSRPGPDVHLVSAAGGIGLPSSALSLLRVITQIRRERG